MAAAFFQHVHEQFLDAIIAVRFIGELADHIHVAVGDTPFIETSSPQRVANSFALVAIPPLMTPMSPTMRFKSEPCWSTVLDT